MIAPSPPDLSGLSALATQSASWDALETVARLASREVSQREVVAAAIERAQAWEPTLGAVVTEDYARALEAQPATGPLHGVPTFIKDLDMVEGLPTGMGSAALRPQPATHTDASVLQFLATGPVVLGKSSTAEFGLTCTTEPVDGAPTRNPHNLGHSVGGSSGGAAALVAAGVVPIAYGSDGGGSIRIPAACCGLVGLKPSRGRLAPLARARMLPIKIATYGVLSRSVRDTWAFYEGVEQAGLARGLPPVGRMADRKDRPLRIGFFVDSGVDREVDPEVVALIRQTAAQLEELGHHVQLVPNPAGRAVLEDFLSYWSLLAAGVKRLVDRNPHGDATLLEPWTLGLGARLGSDWRALPGALWRLRRYTATYRKRFEDLDILVGPTMGGPAPRLGFVSPSLHPDVKQPRLEQLVPFTPPQNISGAPGLSLPLGRSASGLPLGVHLAADRGQEGLLLTLGAQLEEAMLGGGTQPGGSA